MTEDRSLSGQAAVPVQAVHPGRLELAWRWTAYGVVPFALAFAVALAVTIIGIPFAWAHIKLAGIALWPIGKVIVPI